MQLGKGGIGIGIEGSGIGIEQIQGGIGIEGSCGIGIKQMELTPDLLKNLK